jgi:hypothetical protein
MRQLSITLKTVPNTIGSCVIPVPVKERSTNQFHPLGLGQDIGSRSVVIDAIGVPNIQTSR